MSKDNIRVIVAQLGAREHYQVPRLCHAHGALVRLYTDFWKPLPPLLQQTIACVSPRAERRLAGRMARDLPDEFISTHSLQAGYWWLRGKLSNDRAAAYEVYYRWGEGFARHVAKSLSKENFTSFFGFSSASLEALQEVRRRGALAVLDEIAPTHLEDRIMAEEQHRFPGWESTFAPTPRSFLERLCAEWDVADRIVVNSDWTRNALVDEGVPPNKIYVIPVSYEDPLLRVSGKSRKENEPLRVLWLGTLCLRKGLPYAIEAAKRLLGKPVTFTFAGPAPVDLAVIDWPENVVVIGQVPRTEVSSLWRSHHVFILPTLSDGFAITQIEAMAHGLPIIVTPNCGDVVEDGLSGVLVPPRDSAALADAVLRFLDGEIDLESASLAAIKRAEAFRPEAIWPLLRDVLSPNASRAGEMSQGTQIRKSNF